MCVLTEYNETTEDVSADERQEMELTDEDATIISTVVAVTTETFIENTNSTLIDEEDHQLEFILMVLIPVALLALLLLSVVFIVINYKRKKAKEGKYFVCSQLQTIASCVNEQSIK